MTSVEPPLERRRTGVDVVLGIALVVLGVAILGHAALASAVSVWFVGWLALVAGILALGAAIFAGGGWSAALSGGLLTAVGLIVLRNPGAGRVSLTLVAGAMFLTGGITRLVVAARVEGPRLMLVVSGLLSAGLGLVVLLNLLEASFTLVGVLLGVQALFDGLTLMLMGRMRAPERAPELAVG